MLNFPTKTINYIKNLLKRQQRQVEENLKEVSEDDPVKEEVAESSEPGTDSYIAEAHTKTIVLTSQLKGVSSSIKEALQKIGKGTYGKCEKCGKQIEVGRLLAMPTASYCLTCSKKVSK